MRKLLGVAAAAATLALSTGAHAAQVVVANADFSQGPSQTDGAYSAGHERGIPGWTTSGGSGTGHWNPTSAHFVDEAAHGPVAWTTGRIGLDPSSAFLGQVIENLVVQANTRYTLSFDVGRYIGQMSTSYELGLIAGWGTSSEFIAAHTFGPIDRAGEFVTRSLVFETGSTGPAIGKSLMIALGSGVQGAGGAAFDNISLDATSTVTAGVPEPATWALMITGFGMAGGLVRRRRSLALAA